jgi:MFS family permease
MRTIPSKGASGEGATRGGFGAVLPIVFMGSVEVSWVSTAYDLTFGSFLLLGGRLGDIMGRRRIPLPRLSRRPSKRLARALGARPKRSGHNCVCRP